MTQETSPSGTLPFVEKEELAAIAARPLGIDYLITNGIHRGNMERVWNLLDLPHTVSR